MLTKPTSGWTSEMGWRWVNLMLTHNKMVQPPTPPKKTGKKLKGKSVRQQKTFYPVTQINQKK
jgi:hypothetical protein